MTFRLRSGSGFPNNIARSAALFQLKICFGNRCYLEQSPRQLAQSPAEDVIVKVDLSNYSQVAAPNAKADIDEALKHLPT